MTWEWRAFLSSWKIVGMACILKQLEDRGCQNSVEMVERGFTEIVKLLRVLYGNCRRRDREESKLFGGYSLSLQIGQKAI
jgi:hypothetical protein